MKKNSAGERLDGRKNLKKNSRGNAKERKAWRTKGETENSAGDVGSSAKEKKQKENLVGLSRREKGSAHKRTSADETTCDNEGFFFFFFFFFCRIGNGERAKSSEIARSNEGNRVNLRVNELEHYHHVTTAVVKSFSKKKFLIEFSLKKSYPLPEKKERKKEKKKKKNPPEWEAPSELNPVTPIRHTSATTSIVTFSWLIHYGKRVSPEITLFPSTSSHNNHFPFFCIFYFPENYKGKKEAKKNSKKKSLPILPIFFVREWMTKEIKNKSRWWQDREDGQVSP